MGLLDQVSTGRRRDPLRACVYGPPGVGKTGFSVASPRSITIPVEDGANRIDVARLPRPKTWSDIRDAIRELRVGKHEYKSLVIDTLDAAEALCWAHVCREGGKASIEAFGYGKGYIAAADEWRVLLADLEALQDAKGMNVILVCHSIVRGFHNPTGDDYDRWTLRLHEKTAAALVKDWVEMLLFATHDDLAVKDDTGKRIGVSTGNRLLRTRHSAGYEAKSRLDVPDPIPLDWSAFQAEVDLAMADPKSLREQFESAAKENLKAQAWVASGGMARATETELRAALRQLRKGGK